LLSVNQSERAKTRQLLIIAATLVLAMSSWFSNAGVVIGDD
jgi:hypothetical protein